MLTVGTMAHDASISHPRANEAVADAVCGTPEHAVILAGRVQRLERERTALIDRVDAQARDRGAPPAIEARMRPQ